MRVRGFGRAVETSTDTSYELEKVLLRLHRGICCPVRVRLSLVRDTHARCASGSADAVATRSRP